jgi:hypothetical protein
MRLFAAVLAAAVLAAPCSAQDKADARAIVQKAIDASGGAELLAKLKAGTGQYKGQMSLFGMDVEFTGDMAYEVPTKYKLVINAEVAGQKVAVEQMVSGTKVVNKVNGAEAPADDKIKAEMKMALKLLEVMQLTPLLDAGKYTLAAEKDADVDGKPAAVVLVTGKDFKDTRLFFDKGTGLVVRTERKGLAPGAGGDTTEVTETTTLSDHRKVNGLLVPFKSVVTHDGKKFMTFAYTKVEVAEKIDPKLIGADD